MISRCWKLVMPCAVAVVWAASVAAAAPDQSIIEARNKLRAGDFDAALNALEPVLSDPATAASGAQARALAADVLAARGEQHFRSARIDNAIADFDRQLELQPGDAPGHWQRGIALYYAEKYEEGARQFELHRTVNPQDVENAAWHFLCLVRSPKGSVEAARKKLIDVTDDPRVPMAAIQQLFAGKQTPEQVLQAAAAADGRARFYADLYVGLFYEALGRKEESSRHMKLAAENPAAKNSYMGDVARAHVALRRTRNSRSGPAD